MQYCVYDEFPRPTTLSVTINEIMLVTKGTGRHLCKTKPNICSWVG